MKYRIGMIIIGVLLLCAFITEIGTQEEKEELTTHEVLGRLLMMVLTDTTNNHTQLEHHTLQLTQIKEELKRINNTLAMMEKSQSGIHNNLFIIKDSFQNIERILQSNEERE